MEPAVGYPQDLARCLDNVQMQLQLQMKIVNHMVQIVYLMALHVLHKESVQIIRLQLLVEIVVQMVLASGILHLASLKNVQMFNLQPMIHVDKYGLEE